MASTGAGCFTMSCLAAACPDLPVSTDTCHKDTARLAEVDFSIFEHMPRTAIMDEIELYLADQHKLLLSKIKTLILQPNNAVRRQSTKEDINRRTRRERTLTSDLAVRSSERSKLSDAIRAAADVVTTAQLTKEERMLKKMLGTSVEFSPTARLSRWDSQQTALAMYSKSASAITLENDEIKPARLKSFLLSPLVELLMGTLVLVNAVFIGSEVDYVAHHPGELAVPIQFTIISYIFTVAFFVELVLRLVSDCYAFLWFDKPKQLMWNYMDIFIVISSIVEVGFDIVTNNQKGHVNLSNLRVVRVIRIFRLIRLFRVARFVRFVRALRLMVYSVLCTLKDVFWAMVLLATIMYIFSILFTSAATSHITQTLVESNIGEIPSLEKHWGSLDNSMRSLFMSVSGGISWTEIIEPLTQVNPVWSYFFLAFISFTYFAVLNVVTGVFCQASLQAATEDQDSMLQVFLRHKQIYIDRFVELFQDLDETNSGFIKLEDYVAKMGDEEVQNYFQSLELDSVDAVTIFELVDDADTNGITIEEFVMGCLKLKGTARSSDMIRLLHGQRLLMDQLGLLCDHFYVERLRKRAAVNVPDLSLDRPISNFKNIPATKQAHM